MIWFVGNEDGPVRIFDHLEIADRTLAEQLEDMREGSPVPLELLGIVQSGPNRADILRSRYWHHHLRADWFDGEQIRRDLDDGDIHIDQPLMNWARSWGYDKLLRHPVG